MHKWDFFGTFDLLPPPSMMGTPSKVRSRSAGHTQRRIFFAKPCGSPILLRYISSYTSIAAIYLCKIDKIAIDTTNMCSHLQRKLFAPDGEYRAIREQIESDPTLTAVVRSRQLHIYRDGKKILVLAGKSAPKIIREDKLTELL